MSGAPVLISWVAVANDPYESVRGELRLEDGQPVPGPTITLLTDTESPWAGRIRDVVLCHRSVPGESEREDRAVEQLTAVLGDSHRFHLQPWDGADPTDHQAIFAFLRERLPQIRQQFKGRELVLHVSPGTPSMHTIWVLMAETGFIEQPFTLVKSYRKRDRHGRPAVVPVELGIETFYKAFRASVPRQVASEDEGVIWDPSRFQTDRMKAIYAEARRFAQLNIPVLIRGERGTGKTTLAAWIRANSPFQRSGVEVWPSVACGQYSPETMRSELFGYKKGAFTGATQDRSGLLDAAHGDTLFLDEIGDVSRDVQRLLIRAIEEKQFLPLGDDQPRASDFRLITATNVDDEALRERLDPDFIDRISLLSLELPPLRDVPDELPWLWAAVYEEATRRAGASGRSRMGAQHHRRIVAALRRHSLPGNLRDLFRVAYHVLVARQDVDEPVKPAEAVEYGLEALRGPGGAAPGQSVSRAVAASFASGAPIDDLVQPAAPLDTRQIFSDLKMFIGAELRRIASNRGTRPEELCDVSDRSLHKWTSGERKKSSED